MKTILKILFSLALMFAVCAFISSASGLPFLPMAGVAFILGAFPRPKGVASGVIVEIWVNYIIERFWKDNAFLRNAYNDSQYVQQGRFVHIPQIGTKPNVVINRQVFPATAVRRADTAVLYGLDEYTTDPTHIPNIDRIHLSYNKQDSVLGDHMAVLDETVADDMLIKWAANAANYKTTGAQIVMGNPSVLEVPPAIGQTGNRFAFTHRDLKNLMTRMNINNVPKSDRFVLIDDNMYDAFYDTLGETNARDFSQYADAANGVVGRLHGFNIMTRSSVLATTGGNVNPLGSVLAADSNLCSLAWQKDTVAFALGDKILFSDPNNPLYYGDLYSTLVMAGGRVRREDGLGVYLIEQGVPDEA